jgi:hypothetical protein
MNLKKAYASLKETFRQALVLPGALAADELIAEDPSFADKLAQAKKIVVEDQAMLSKYLPPPMVVGGHIGAYAIWPQQPSAYALLGRNAERIQKIDGGSYKDAFKKAVENVCAAGRRLNSESDVRRRHPDLFGQKPPKPWL